MNQDLAVTLLGRGKNGNEILVILDNILADFASQDDDAESADDSLI